MACDIRSGGSFLFRSPSLLAYLDQAPARHRGGAVVGYLGTLHAVASCSFSFERQALLRSLTYIALGGRRVDISYIIFLV